MSWQTVPIRQFASHAAEWDALQSRSTRVPFLESAFLLPLIEVFGHDGLRLAFLPGRQGWQAATLLQPLGTGRWQTFQPSQLPLGPWLQEPAVDGSPDGPDAHAAQLLQALPGLALGLGLTQLDPRLCRRPADGGAWQTLDYISTSWVDVAGSFDDYWAQRGKNLRQNTRKQLNKLQAEGLAVRLDCVSDPADVDAALAQYGALETAGWKADTGTAIAADNDQGRFYGGMLKRFCAQGRGRLYRYWFGDAVVAMDLCIDNGPLVVILKTAYDERHRAVSPSTLMRHEQFRQWWQEGRYQRIEFYGKTMEWHTRWTDSHRMLYHANAYRWAGLRRAHEWIKSLRARPSAEPAAAAPVASPAPAAPAAATSAEASP